MRVFSQINNCQLKNEKNKKQKQNKRGGGLRISYVKNTCGVKKKMINEELCINNIVVQLRNREIT